MPTGYTCDVQSGKITDFNTFAMQCVRAMGVCVMMRDEPSSTPIPERWEPNTKYHDDKIEAANVRKAALLAMSESEIEQECLKDHEQAMKYHLDSLGKNRKERQRYEDMLVKVQTWKPPTGEHEGFKKFMVDQLLESIRFDCGSESERPQLPTVQEWKRKQLESVTWDITYHTKAKAEEIERTELRNKWMKDFRESL